MRLLSSPPVETPPDWLPSTDPRFRSSRVGALPSYERSSGLLTPETVTRNEQTSRQLHLHRACYPVWYPEPRGIESHQWQTDVSIVYPAGEVPCALTRFRPTGGQPHPICLENWLEIESHPSWKHDRCRPGLEGWPWTHEHDEDFIRPQ